MNMSDSKNSKQGAMSMESFRAKKAAGASSSPGQKSAGNDGKKANTSLADSAAKSSNSRPSSAASKSRSTSMDNLSGKTNISIQERQDKVKQMRDKQVEERKRKNEERRLAFEERRRQKEEEEKLKWDTLKGQTAKQRPGTGRKLPNLPEGLRTSASTTTHARPSGLPKPLRATTVTSNSPSSVKSPGHSNSSLSSDSSSTLSPSSTPATSRGKGSLGTARATSATNLDSAQRRSSADNLLSTSAANSKSRPSSLYGPHQKPSLAKSHNSLAPGMRTVKKAHSTSALHHIGLDRPPLHSPKKHPKEVPKPKAGMLDEAGAKQALAERRKKAREEAEAKAKLDKERQEQERIKKEEEERRLAEEMAIEEERMQKLAEMLKQQEEERLQKAVEEKEKLDQEEAERSAEEERLKEEERKVREEQEKLAREEAEKKAKEDEERRRVEEIERQERRRRVEEIMSRTRNKTGSPSTELTADSATSPVQELDVEDTKRKVNEILQKAKERSVSPQNFTKLETSSSMSSLDSETNQFAETDNMAEDNAEPPQGLMKPIDSAEDILKSMKMEMSEEKSDEELKSVENSEMQTYSEDTVVKVRVRISDSTTKVHVNGKELTRTISRESECSVSGKDDIPSICVEDEGSSMLCSDGNAAINGLEQREMTDVRQVNLSEENNDQELEEQQLWTETESIMARKAGEANERLEDAGIVTEGVDDEEEGQLWKVVEGSVRLSDVA